MKIFTGRVEGMAGVEVPVANWGLQRISSIQSGVKVLIFCQSLIG
jgi:hypothetical protein